ncbi:MAG: hypothetical protein IPG39_06210 [Bacteroidetes bacterium]|nr:hypothetical protein [Bacteroidota bacterium]
MGPIEQVELGNEFYRDADVECEYSEIFPTAADYVTVSQYWTEKSKKDLVLKFALQGLIPEIIQSSRYLECQFKFEFLNKQIFLMLQQYMLIKGPKLVEEVIVSGLIIHLSILTRVMLINF